MHWYAVQVTTRHENKVKKYLEKQKNNGLAGKVGQVLTIQDSLSGYVFIESDMWPEPYLRGLATWHRVIGQVSWAEIAGMMDSAGQFTPFKQGDRVEILGGPLMGLIGTVKHAGPERSKVVVTFFNDKVAVEVENQMLRSA
ncbi:MAG: hypothetical protein C4575_07025 [Desulforudis sp.]|nr:MAG: hypothetical protein C4575_07025 [Desulforudis sp.]